MVGRFLSAVPSLPQVAEFVDERPEEVKQMETFRSSAKWKLLDGEFHQEMKLNLLCVGEKAFSFRAL